MEDSRQEGAEDGEEDQEESEDEALGEAPPVEEDAGCSQEGSEDEDDEGEGGEEEDMMDEEQSETVANTEDYDAKHVRFRYHEYLLQTFLKKYFFFASFSYSSCFRESSNSGSVNIFYGSESADPKFDSESGSGRSINCRFCRIRILSRHYCGH
jgi:hypothetical protein